MTNDIQKTFGVHLAEAHLKTELSDYVIVGFDRQKKILHTIFSTRDKQTLEFLFTKFLEDTQNKFHEASQN